MVNESIKKLFINRLIEIYVYIYILKATVKYYIKNVNMKSKCLIATNILRKIVYYNNFY